MKTVDVTRLHRVHAAPTTGNSFELGGFRWRGDGGPRGSHELKAAIAYRAVFTWNMAEGIPTKALELGLVRQVYDLLDELLEVRRKADELAPPVMERILAKLEATIEAHGFDTTHGRLHDCEGCLEEEGADDR